MTKLWTFLLVLWVWSFFATCATRTDHVYLKLWTLAMMTIVIACHLRQGIRSEKAPLVID